jgi:hypothetical protein
MKKAMSLTIKSKKFHIKSLKKTKNQINLQVSEADYKRIGKMLKP